MLYRKQKNNKPKSQGLALSLYFSCLGLALAIVLAVTGSITYWLVIKPSTTQFAQTLTDTRTTSIAQSLSSNLYLWKQAMENLVNQSELHTALAQDDILGIRDWETQAQQLLPHIIDVKVIKREFLQQAEVLQATFGYASYELITKTNDETIPPPEMHYINTDQAHLKFSQPVVDAHNNLLGTVLISFSPTLINEVLNAFQLSPNYIELWQNTSGEQPHIFLHNGDKTARISQPDSIISLDNTNWQLAYWNQVSTPHISHHNSLALTKALGVAILVILLVLCMTYRYLYLKLISDLGKLTAALSILPKPVVPIIGYGLAIFNEKMKSITATQMNTDDSSHEDEPTHPDMTDISEKTLTLDPLFQHNSMLDLDEIEQRANTLPKEIFRAYDIRGIVDETLNADIIHDIGMAIGSEAITLGLQQITIGRDGRLTSEAFSQALTEGLIATGVNVINVGIVPSPVLYFAAHHLSQYSGVMITGSHNPGQYNGLKIVLGGETLALDRIQMLYQRLTQNTLLSGQGTTQEQRIDEQYIEAITQNISLARPLKIVIDCGNGVTGHIAPRLFEALGCEVIPLFCEIDGHFPNHHPDPSQIENLATLIQTVQQEQADVGLAFDGDGDRLGVITDQGEIIWPDRQLMLYATQVLAAQPGSDIIFDVKCSKQLAEVITQQGGSPIMWKTGHSHIKTKLRELNAPLAGEMSGHIFFNDRWFGFDDALYTAARLLEITSYDPNMRTVDALFKALPNSINTPEIKIDIAEDKKFKFMEDLISRAEFGNNAKLITLDGLRVEYADGWGLIRPSNTTASLVLRFEADSELSLARIQQIFRQQIQAVDSSLVLHF